MMAGEMFTSMQSSMTTSLQLAKDCLESESKSPQKSDPIEGVQKFALMIDSGKTFSCINLLKITYLFLTFIWQNSLCYNS